MIETKESLLSDNDEDLEAATEEAATEEAATAA